MRGCCALAGAVDASAAVDAAAAAEASAAFGVTGTTAEVVQPVDLQSLYNKLQGRYIFSYSYLASVQYLNISAKSGLCRVMSVPWPSFSFLARSIAKI